MIQAEFVPFSTFIDTTFWAELNRRKLHEWRLDETPRNIAGFFSLCECQSEIVFYWLRYECAVFDYSYDYNLFGNILELMLLIFTAYSATSLASRITLWLGIETVGDYCWLSLGHESFEQSYTNAYHGRLLLYNTLESFKGLDRRSLLKSEAQKIWHVIESGEWLEHPEYLTTFVFTVYADLKKYQYYYWNCFPTLCYPSDMKQEVSERPVLLHAYNFKEYHERLPRGYEGRHILPINQPIIIGNRLPVAPIAVDERLSQYFDDKKAHAFLLNSSGDCFPLSELTKISTSDEMKIYVRFSRLMEQSVGLNLSLIKWRLVPDMRLERCTSLKFQETLRSICGPRKVLNCGIAIGANQLRLCAV
ncbi:unnamed protein product [Strongylus vulgaris]|uniref:Ubiquitin-like modifier-activating enzyme Atg7 N-terminal domain-containing protein n=1 Tax=Strongylus vulgaris TaxID=40348 RepID=A0A3P7J184_STRVU|nr:unnamed protein product [Strongylus vulgaris]